MEGPIFEIASIQIMGPEEAYEWLLGTIESLRQCREHDHREDIYRLEKLKKVMLEDMSDRWN